MSNVERAYELAREQYGELGIDTEKAMATLRTIPISLHCWQGDDVGGFEGEDGITGGGIMATGSYPGRARNAAELRSDLDQAYKMIPGSHRLNLHALYAETGGKRVDRDALQPEHFTNWLDWAKANNHGLDFNPSFFSHPKAAAGFTLASQDKGIRDFWIQHGIACRKIGEYFGKSLNNACVTNVWIPDGYKDTPADRLKPRQILSESLDAVFAEKIDKAHHLDAVEGKLFGLAFESYTVGSHEFYLGYAVKNNVLLCLDAGHYHPTESIADKLSAVLCNLDEILLHVSRPVRWDSDHVVTLSDELRAVAEEVVRDNLQSRIHIGLDFFDASINRVAAWVIGTRCMLKALLIALLEPTRQIRDAELSENFTARLALQEEAKTMPFGAVWDYYCLQQGVPVGAQWLKEVQDYEGRVQLKRG